MENYPLISIIILTYNAEKYIVDCLNSVLSQSYANIEIIIIDNNSIDRTIKILKELNFNPKIKTIFNSQNIGFSAGQNQGIKESRGEFILCLNQDVVLEKDFIRRGIEAILKNEKIGAVQGKLLRVKNGIKTDIIDTTGLIILKNRRIISRGQGIKDDREYSRNVFGADGAAPLYRKNALEDVKINQEYFDEDFNMYKEDTDLAWRLRLFGWEAVYESRAVAWHWRGSGDSAVRTPWEIIRERRKINNFSKYLSFKNQRLMQIKNETSYLFFRHLPWIIIKEIGAWFYILFFEKYTLSAIRELFGQAPKAWQKRKIIMARKRIKTEELERWFE